MSPSQDGADLGVSADKAFHAIIGNEQPTEEDMRTPEQMRAWLMDAPMTSVVEEVEARGGEYTDDDYGECARRVAGAVLRTVEQHPERLSDDDLLWESVKLTFPFVEREGVSGFQWGWAVNAAKYTLGVPPGPNLAIVNLDTGDHR